ncbi:hypothetical protein [Actinomycetospora aeridis]|uniref:Uncharacterized protein n=1 Tax=Actinomycetospora aeridis TaxID=3129231 RepID=A0ABU8N1B0_9PSEU
MTIDEARLPPTIGVLLLALVCPTAWWQWSLLLLACSWVALGAPKPDRE